MVSQLVSWKSSQFPFLRDISPFQSRKQMVKQICSPKKCHSCHECLERTTLFFTYGRPNTVTVTTMGRWTRWISWIAVIRTWRNLRFFSWSVFPFLDFYTELEKRIPIFILVRRHFGYSSCVPKIYWSYIDLGVPYLRIIPEWAAGLTSSMPLVHLTKTHFFLE